MASRPAWALKWLSLGELEQLQQHIAKIEAQTQGEVVIVFSRAQSWAQGLIILFWMLLGYAFGTLVHNEYASLGGALVGLLWGMGPWCRRVFLSSDWVAQQLKNRALLYYYLSGLAKVPSQSGVLLYVCVTERRVHLLVGEALKDLGNSRTWDQVLAPTLPHFKNGNFYKGLDLCLSEIEGILLAGFKKVEGKPNEFLHDVVFLDEKI